LPDFVGTPAPLEAAAPARLPVGPVNTPPAEPVSTAVFTARPTGPDIVPAGAQEAPRRNERMERMERMEDTPVFSIDPELPGMERITRRESENEFFERLRLDFPSGTRFILPTEIPLTAEPFERRQFARVVKSVEPAYVCHGRLLFEQPNFERQGWDLGIVTPLVNLGVYYWDLALLPYHCATRPFQQFDCSAGKCLPGDPTPLYLYPEEFSVSGLAGQAAVVTGLFFLFP
jgi:hypothetical protein